ncbi:uncharacterized protein LAESUDRAFT_94878 [Laetiporus sulphureus 93-53]|uniref:Uncharacterized protein n=1 Tax=Laetiporus sulphureus 93-53 TaxID=1314785 RepID=A0A165ATR7_9APHY|nr:uncharacterized protein LAESUDRAFT_94878 [Laetiporus sulphureus 93-53]KZS99647.1 hypothetical protein LAESUDRAFT_94878 [Laetiporus sulphureus 93-53]
MPSSSICCDCISGVVEHAVARRRVPLPTFVRLRPQIHAVPERPRNALSLCSISCASGVPRPCIDIDSIFTGQIVTVPVHFMWTSIPRATKTLMRGDPARALDQGGQTRYACRRSRATRMY